jgi:hypothetical protein
MKKPAARVPNRASLACDIGNGLSFSNYNVSQNGADGNMIRSVPCRDYCKFFSRDLRYFLSRQAKAAIAAAFDVGLACWKELY